MPVPSLPLHKPRQAFGTALRVNCMLCGRLRRKGIKMNNVVINWGNPKENDYELILDYFSGTKINSIQTSSIPLAQYWKNYQHGLSVLSNKINIKNKNISMFFEFPTKSFRSNKSSMTDLMILSDNNKIAIESKYTEYEKSIYESISSWYNKNKSENKLNVLNHWKNIISEFSNGCFDESSELAYQFLHRTASACYENKNIAYVMYQLFWDDNTRKSLKLFEDDIKKYIRIISPNNRLKYLIHKIEIVNIAQTKMDSIFQEMKYKNIYEFGNEEIEFA